MLLRACALAAVALAAVRCGGDGGNPVSPDETHADLTQALASAVTWLQAR